MIAWSRRRTLIAGATLIVLSNAMALAGVVWNRSAPESSLRLTQRELRLPWAWGFSAENSGLALQLAWRTSIFQREGSSPVDMSQATSGGMPAWLDQTKLAGLGFDVSRTDTTTGRSRFERQLPRAVLVVLELDGPAYRETLERARNHADAEEALRAANPGKQEFETRAYQARERLGREEREASRLFAVDAGFDAAALRAKYPDRARYAIVRGQVSPQFVDESDRGWGTIRLSVDSINVPHEYHAVLDPALWRGVRATNVYQDMKAAAPFESTVDFGKRFEPWMTTMRRETGAQRQESAPRH